MSDDEKVTVHADVPTTSLAVVPKGQAEAQRLARRIGGEKPKNEAHLHCLTCGWSGTILFSEEEMEALIVEGDPESYGGPCPGSEKDENGKPKLDENGQPIPCLAMTLQPMSRFVGGDFKSINDMAAENRRRDLREQGEVIGEVVGDKIVSKVGAAVGDLILGSAGPVEPSSEEKG